MGIGVGSVSLLARYPVKSMGGEELEQIYLGEGGVAGDRLYALLDLETGRIASAKNYKVFGRLLDFRARLIGGDAVEISFPGGGRVSTLDGDVDEALSRALGRRVKLLGSPPPAARILRMNPFTGELRESELAPGTFLDGAEVHLLTSSSLSWLGKLVGDAPDAWRFRPNILLETEGVGRLEDGWVGGLLRVGEAILRVERPTRRCSIISLGEEGRVDRLGYLKALKEHGGTLGVYCSVVSPGWVRLGDKAEILRP